MYTLYGAQKKLKILKSFLTEVFYHEGKAQAFIDDLLIEIDESKHTTLSHCIYSFGIYNIGIKRSQDLANYFKTLENFAKCTKKQLLQIQSISDSHAETILTFLKYFKKEMIRLHRILQWKGE